MNLLERQGRHPHATLRDLRDVLGLDKSNITRLCQRMERAGLIGFEPCPTDGRAKCIRLTAKGTRVAQTVEASSRAEFAALLDKIPGGARKSVVEALEMLVDAIRQDQPPAVIGRSA